MQAPIDCFRKLINFPREGNQLHGMMHENRRGREYPEAAGYVYHRLENLTTVQKKYPQFPRISYEGIDHTLTRNAGSQDIRVMTR